MRTPSFLIFLAVILVLATGIGAVAYITLTPLLPPPLTPPRAGGEIGQISPPPGGENLPAGRQVRGDPDRPVVTSASPLRGDPIAPITIFEFGDFLCVPCAESASILHSVLEQYAGKVKLIWKDLPNTSRHPLAQKAAEAARCAAEQGKFWEYHDALLEQTNQGQALTEQGLALVAQKLAINMGDFTECLASERTKELVERDTNEAILLRVDATPYFFIGTERFSGAIPETRLKEIIEKMQK